MSAMSCSISDFRLSVLRKCSRFNEAPCRVGYPCRAGYPCRVRDIHAVRDIMPGGIPCRAGLTVPCGIPMPRPADPHEASGRTWLQCPPALCHSGAARRGNAMGGVAYIVMIGAAVGLVEAAEEEEAVAVAVDVADDAEDDDDAA